MGEVGAGRKGAGQVQEPGAQEVPDVLVVVQVEQHGGQVERAVAGQDGRVDVDHAGDRGAVGEQVGRGEVVVNEVLAGRAVFTGCATGATSPPAWNSDRASCP